MNPLRIVSPIGFAVAAAAAHAQELPPSLDPGRIERRLEQPPPPRAAPPIPAPPAPRGAAPAEAAQVRFVLRRLGVQGATAIAEADLLAPYAPLIGQEVSLAQIFEAAEEMTARYRREGHLLSQVVVPVQEIRNGEVRLAAVEGFIARIAVVGVEGSEKSSMERRLGPLLAERPLSAARLERQLLLVNDLPGVTARAVLAPSTVPGASDLTLEVAREAIAGYAALDNRGTELVGPEQATFGAQLHSPFGFDERLSFRAALASPARELRFGEASLDAPVGVSGSMLGLRVSRTLTEPSGDLSPLDVEGRSRIGEASVAYPALRSRAENLTLRALFTALDSDVDVLGQPFSEDRLRIVTVAASYDLVDAWDGISSLSAEAAQGLEAFGASRAGDPSLSRANGRPAFTRFDLTASRLQNLGGGFGLLAEASGQYALSQLLASEEFGVGGARFGRAYDASEITGDHGIAASLELRYGRALDDPWLRSYQLYGFADFGAVWRIDDGSSDDRESLASAGMGVRLNVMESVSASLEVARPLTATPATEDERRPRVFFTLVRRF